MSTPAADPELLAAACRFASEAGALTLEWFRKGDLNLEHKVDGTPVTAADKAAEARLRRLIGDFAPAVSYTHLRAHENVLDLVCRLLLEKKKN